MSQAASRCRSAEPQRGSLELPLAQLLVDESVLQWPRRHQEEEGAWRKRTRWPEEPPEDQEEAAARE